MRGLQGPWFWENQGPDGYIVPEAPLGSVERMLLRTSPEAASYVRDTESGTPRRRRREQA